MAQIARSIARELALDEDLTEALALAHDLGHPPFGHAGEEALNLAMKPFGGFDHNAQSLRVVTLLESRYAGWDGLNLTWETLEGLAKHRLGQRRQDGPAQVDHDVVAGDVAHPPHDLVDRGADRVEVRLVGLGQVRGQAHDLDALLSQPTGDRAAVQAAGGGERHRLAAQRRRVHARFLVELSFPGRQG